jgi:hypothetical protein
MSSLKSDRNKKVELVFPRQETKYDTYLPKVKPSDFFGLFTTDTESVGESFKAIQGRFNISTNQWYNRD